MKKLYKIYKLSLLFLFYSGGIYAQIPEHFTISKPESVGFSSERLKRLDIYLQKVIDSGLAPNAVAFVARKGKIVYFKGFGARNLESKTTVSRDDIYRIASQSKAIVTVALMMLWEEGKFLLDDPISKYIPAFKDANVLVSFDTITLEYRTRPAKSPITVRELLDHTAGIPYDHPMEKRNDFRIPHLNSLDTVTLAGVIPKLARRPLVFDPGEQFVYGLNIDVIGYLVEILSGTKLDVFLKKRIFKPLGMLDTYFYLPVEKQTRLVELYSKSSREVPLTVDEDYANRKFSVAGAKTYFSGGAGLVGSIEDYAKFAQMILNKGEFNNHRLLGRKTLDLMGTNQIGTNNVFGRHDKFGLGFQIVTDSTYYAEPASAGSLTWGGAFCTEFTIDSKEELVMLVYTNVHPYFYYSDFLRTFRVLVYQALN